MGKPPAIGALVMVFAICACAPYVTARRGSPTDLSVWQILTRVDRADRAYGSDHADGWLAIKTGGPNRSTAFIFVRFRGDATLIPPFRWRMQEAITTSHVGQTTRVVMENYRVGQRVALALPHVGHWTCLNLVKLGSLSILFHQIKMGPERLNRIAKAWIVTSPKRHTTVTRVDALLKSTPEDRSTHTLVTYDVSAANYLVTSMTEESSGRHGRHWANVSSYVRLSRYGEGVPAWLPMCKPGPLSLGGRV